MKKLLGSLFFFMILPPVIAHEFWLDPISFFSTKACVRFKVGEHFSGENWNGDYQKVKLLEMVNHSERSITNAQQMLPNEGDSLQFVLPFIGTQILVYNGVNSFISQDAKAFNEYLKEDGLTEVLEERRSKGMDTAMGREYYQRSAKTLLQNGSLKTPCNFPTELPLDIVPLQHPYSITTPTTLSFQVFFQQRPLQKALIRTWHLLDGKLTAGSIEMTNSTFELPVLPKGKWMVSLVKMVPNSIDDQADWQSYWGSLTWGYY